jgi:hypothetical protein
MAAIRFSLGDCRPFPEADPQAETKKGVAPSTNTMLADFVAFKRVQAESVDFCTNAVRGIVASACAGIVGLWIGWESSNELLRLHSHCCGCPRKTISDAVATPSRQLLRYMCTNHLPSFCYWVRRKVKAAALETVKAGQPAPEVLQQLEAELEAMKLEQVSSCLPSLQPPCPHVAIMACKLFQAATRWHGRDHTERSGSRIPNYITPCKWTFCCLAWLTEALP